MPRRTRAEGARRSCRWRLAAQALFFLLLVAWQDPGANSYRARTNFGRDKGEDSAGGIRNTEAWEKMSSMERMAETGCVERSEEDVRAQEKQKAATEALLAKAKAALEKVFGYSQLRGQQENVIQALLNGQDAFGVMPTGAGKSICYQVRETTNLQGTPASLRT